MSYHYEELDRTDNEIRVVEVLPTLVNDTVNCVIRHTKLSQRYSCLSYTWGDSQRQHQISLNGRIFQVGTNLYQFLLHRARSIRAQEPIWIDALCVNQADNRERNHQVRLMGQIYGGASEVIVWLGDIRQSMKSFFRFIDVDRSLPACLPRQHIRMKIEKMLMGPASDQENIWHALKEICDSGYWKRAWTVQEFVLAHRLVLTCGAAQIDMSRFEDFVLEWSDASERHRSWDPEYSELGGFPEYNMQRLKRQEHKSGKVYLEQLLLEFHDSQCVDEVDRVYAMLSLARYGRDFRVDYSEPKLNLLIRTLCFCKLDEHEELWELASVLSRMLCLSLQDQETVQNLLIEAQRSKDLDETFTSLPITIVEVSLLDEDQLDPTEAKSSISCALCCPLQYEGHRYKQELFNFVCNPDIQVGPVKFYLVQIAASWLDLQLVCVQHRESQAFGTVVGFAIEHTMQIADVVYMVLYPHSLNGMRVPLQGHEDRYKMPFTYKQITDLLDFTQIQSDTREEIDWYDELRFRRLQYVRMGERAD